MSKQLEKLKKKARRANIEARQGRQAECIWYTVAAARLGLSTARIGQLVRDGKLASGPKRAGKATVMTASIDEYERGKRE